MSAHVIVPGWDRWCPSKHKKCCNRGQAGYGWVLVLMVLVWKVALKAEHLFNQRRECPRLPSCRRTSSRWTMDAFAAQFGVISLLGWKSSTSKPLGRLGKWSSQFTTDLCKATTNAWSLFDLSVWKLSGWSCIFTHLPCFKPCFLRFLTRFLYLGQATRWNHHRNDWLGWPCSSGPDLFCGWFRVGPSLEAHQKRDVWVPLIRPLIYFASF